MHQIRLGQRFQDNVIHFVGQIDDHVMVIPDKGAHKKTDVLFYGRVFRVKGDVKEIDRQVLFDDVVKDLRVVIDDLREVDRRALPLAKGSSRREPIGRRNFSL